MAETGRMDQMNHNLLEVSGLRAAYGRREVLSGLSLEIRRGEVCALLGLNGSGKSTLLRAALGLLPAQGTVLACGQDVRAMDARTRAALLGYIPQRSRLDDGVTALDAVLMGANASMPLFAGYSRAQRERALHCLERLGAAQLAGQMMGTLSQGQRQLVIFARTMMQQPKILLLDEPDSALDLPRRTEMMAQVRALCDQDGCALCALHDASLALTACDRVLILKDGVIACELDMHTASRQTAEEAMRLLYGSAQVLRAGDRWAVIG